MMGKLSPALRGQFPAQAVKPIPCRKVGGCLMAPLQLNHPYSPQAGRAQLPPARDRGREEDKNGREAWGRGE